MENETQTSTPDLNITDLQNLRAIVDTASRRGAFAANEMSAVGATFDRLTAFLNAAAQANQENKETAQDSAPAA